MDFDDTANALKLTDTEDAVVGFRTQAPTPGMIRPLNPSSILRLRAAAPSAD
jgi:hypothetical protein